jgi:rare lipoprotein A
MEKLTAAHRTFPFGTKLRVQSLVTQKTVEIRVNDRGPFVGDRIIDLSHAAAQTIDMQGVANVRLEVLSMPPTRAADVFAVQIGAFTQRAEADRLMGDMQKRYGVARLVFREGDQTWRVLVGLEPTMEGAQSIAQQLQKESSDALVVRVDTEQ